MGHFLFFFQVISLGLVDFAKEPVSTLSMALMVADVAADKRLGDNQI
jgi:hypothetical protein